MHLLLEGDLSSPPLREWGLRRWLSQMPRQIGMTKIRGPFVQAIPRGLSGLVVIAESHISVHLLYEGMEEVAEPNVGMLRLPRPYGYVDIFSCKGFDAAAVEALVATGLRMQVRSRRVIPRGLEYPVPETVAAAQRGAAGIARDRAYPWQEGYRREGGEPA